MTSATGTIQVDVDLSQEAILGKASQRDAAVRDYLRQFDRARQRGEGDAALMTQFKDAFSAMHSQYGNEAPPDLLSREITLSRGDRSALSGMADFSASISQVSQSPNAILPEERDSFRFAVSQRTQVGGANTPNRSLRQEQQASLSASYHRQIDAETPMNLAGPRETQNYLYIEIQDRSSSTTDIAYRDGALIKAQVKTWSMNRPRPRALSTASRPTAAWSLRKARRPRACARSCAPPTAPPRPMPPICCASMCRS